MSIKEKSWRPLGKKHNWMTRGQGFICKLIIKDETGRNLDKFLWNSNKKFKEILELLRLKYGIC